MLEDVGLVPAQERAYVVLVGRPEASLEEVAAESGLSVRQTARALERLCEHGLVNRLPGRRRQYVAVAPSIALEALIQAKEDRLGRARLDMQMLSAMFDGARRGSHPGQLIEVIVGQANVSERFDQLQHGAKQQVCVFDRPPYARPTTSSNDIEPTMLERAVRYRSVYHPSALALPGHPEALRRYVAAGEEARVFPDVPVKMVLVDETIGLLPFVDTGAPTETITSAILVRPSSLLDGLNALFELVWAQARPFGIEPAVGDGGLDELGEQEQEVLALLAAGLTDKALSRALHVSGRTVQRHVHNLMRRLGAVTRFQAGVEVGRRGWVGRP